MKLIKYKGLRRLNTLQIREVKRLTEQEFRKIKYDFKDCDIFVDVKKQEKAGNRFKFSLLEIISRFFGSNPAEIP